MILERIRHLEAQAAGDPEARAALQRAREIVQAAQQKLRDLEMTAVNLDTRTPGFSQVQVKDKQAPEVPGTSAVQVPGLPGSSATDLKTDLPGTSAVQVPGLPGTTETRLGDNGVLHAQATSQQPATRRLPENLNAFVETTAQQARYMATLAFGGPALFRLAPELWAAALALARGGLGNWLRQPQPVPVRTPTAPPR
jgi:hypothetical protein